MVVDFDYQEEDDFELDDDDTSRLESACFDEALMELMYIESSEEWLKRSREAMKLAKEKSKERTKAYEERVNKHFDQHREENMSNILINNYLLLNHNDRCATNNCTGTPKYRCNTFGRSNQ
jgi:hypothetical protein